MANRSAGCPFSTSICAPEPTAATPETPKYGTNGAGATRAAAAADAEVVLVKEASKKAVAAASAPAEPKIFVSPRAPDDPGPVVASKKN